MADDDGEQENNQKSEEELKQELEGQSQQECESPKAKYQHSQESAGQQLNGSLKESAETKIYARSYERTEFERYLIARERIKELVVK